MRPVPTFILRIGLVCALAGWAGSAAADAPTPTPTVTPTCTITPTTVPIIVVGINHNRFNPLAGERVQVLGLRPDHGNVTIRVYDLSGTLIRTLMNGQAVGAVPPAWDGKNEQGQTVASGVYLIVASGNKLHKRFRIAVLK